MSSCSDPWFISPPCKITPLIFNASCTMHPPHAPIRKTFIYLFFWEVWVWAGMWAYEAGCLRQWVAACQTQRSRDCDDRDRVEWLQALSSQCHVSDTSCSRSGLQRSPLYCDRGHMWEAGGGCGVQRCFWLLASLIKGHYSFGVRMDCV